MNTLTPLEYNKQEEKAVRWMPNRIVEAFQPTTFLSLGYPTRIHDISEISKYADVMHENSLDKIFELFLGGLTEDEFKLIKNLIDVSSDMVFKYTDKFVVPRASLFAALTHLRHIRYFFPDSGSTILEIGPGCGYLGALFSMLGYTYISMDVTQAFYIYQNKLYQQIYLYI